jgi:hypothetical protein
MNAQATKLQAAENDLKQLMALALSLRLRERYKYRVGSVDERRHDFLRVLSKGVGARTKPSYSRRAR